MVGFLKAKNPNQRFFDEWLQIATTPNIWLHTLQDGAPQLCQLVEKIPSKYSYLRIIHQLVIIVLNASPYAIELESHPSEWRTLFQQNDRLSMCPCFSRIFSRATPISMAKEQKCGKKWELNPIFMYPLVSKMSPQVMVSSWDGGIGGLSHLIVSLLPSGYLLHSHGKIHHAKKRTVNHLFRLGPSIPTMANCNSHNQRVNPIFMYYPMNIPSTPDVSDEICGTSWNTRVCPAALWRRVRCRDRDLRDLWHRRSR